MTDAAELLTQLADIATAQEAAAAACDGSTCLIVGGQGSLALGVDPATRVLHFVGLDRAKEYSHAVATIHAEHWNKRLTAEQVAANCNVVVMRKRDALLANAASLREALASVG